MPLWPRLLGHEQFFDEQFLYYRCHCLVVVQTNANVIARLWCMLKG
jgi:hypothetical protein